MIRLILFIFIFLYSCNKQNEVNPMQYGDTGLDEHYFINLDWNNNLSTSKTAVNIKWNQWIQNDSTEFIKYSIKDVTTENVKLIEEINSFSDTSYSVEFPTGTYLRLCVIAKSAHNQLGTVYYQSSDSILFFTEPLSSVSNIDIDSNPDEHIITWKPSPDENIDNLKGLEVELIYKWEVGSMLIFDRTHLHCASSVIEGKKIGITTFTKK